MYSNIFYHWLWTCENWVNDTELIWQPVKLSLRGPWASYCISVLFVAVGGSPAIKTVCWVVSPMPDFRWENHNICVQGTNEWRFWKKVCSKMFLCLGYFQARFSQKSKGILPTCPYGPINSHKMFTDMLVGNPKKLLLLFLVVAAGLMCYVCVDVYYRQHSADGSTH